MIVVGSVVGVAGAGAIIWFFFFRGADAAAKTAGKTA